MGRINIDIPDDLHDQLRKESTVKRVPIKMIVIKSLREHVQQTELNTSSELEE